jgi:medium-chain acyl-[acyl-carrier-protein] hydrolase
VEVHVADTRLSWLTTFADVSDPACELVCFPHAGGGSSVFHTWQRHTKTLRVSAVQLPGRELRLGEPAIDTVEVLVDALVPALRRVVGGRYAFFGHSMGALVAFELTRRLRATGLPLPVGLFVAGLDAPQLLNVDRTHDLPRDELLAWLSAGNGLDPEALRYPELIDLMLPTIRADLGMVENYRYRSEPSLPVPIHVFRGRDDEQVTAKGQAGWAVHTSAGCTDTKLDGDHFFVRHHEELIVWVIEASLLVEGVGR